MIQVTFAEVQMAVEIAPNGFRVIRIIDPASGTQYLLPLDPLVAQQLATQLRGLSIVTPDNGHEKQEGN